MKDLEKRFTYHPPLPNQVERYKSIRHAALQFAELIKVSTPESREQSLALTNLEQTVMWANKAISQEDS